MEIKRFSDFIICPIPAVSELDQAEIEQIATRSSNSRNKGKYNSGKKGGNSNRKYSKG